MHSSYSHPHDFFGNTTPEALVREFGSPLYVYNEGVLRQRCRDLLGLADRPGFIVSYSTKANGNPYLLAVIREEGLHADAMSPGELALLRQAGFTRGEITYVCNNVSQDELAQAAEGSSLVSVDSLSQLAAFGRAVPGGRVMVRINPGIGAGHHEKVITAGKTTKFGVLPESFPVMRKILQKYDLQLVGLNHHVGSLFLQSDAYLAAARFMLDTASEFLPLEVIDFGGGFGIPYRKETEPRLNLNRFSSDFTDLVNDWSAQHGYQGNFVIEPGRYVVAESGICLGTVHAVKDNGATRFVGTDIGFSVLVRPAMYDSYHGVAVYGDSVAERARIQQTLVGNICETGDVLAKNRELPEMREGDIVGILDAGAYCSSMSSNYNQRLRPAEVLINLQGETRLIRRRDTIEDLLRVYG